MGGAESNYIEKISYMKQSILLLNILCFGAGTLDAQETASSKNKLGVALSTNFFRFNNEQSKINVGGGFYYTRKLSNRFSIYTEINGSSRNYGNLSLMPGLVGDFTTGNVAIYIGPMFEIGDKMNLSLGLGENYLFNPELKTATGTIDIRKETTNYSTLYFDIRKSIYKEVTLGIRYEWGLNSMFEKTDSKVTHISFNVFLPLKGKRNQEKDK
jgi:hypothetical protein